jgi:hypothetical protein
VKPDIKNKENDMEKKMPNASGAIAGAVWFIGWLFTIGFAQLGFWKIVLGIIVWPYYLGQHLR